MPRIIAISSGRERVGKTSLSLNLALQMARRGQRVCLADAHASLGGVEHLLGLRPHYALTDVVERRCKLEQLLLRNQFGIDILPLGTGLDDLSQPDSGRCDMLVRPFAALDDYHDLLVDTTSGSARGVVALAAAAPELIVVITPEPTALTEAYALLKKVVRSGFDGRLCIVVNQSDTPETARHTYEKFREVVQVYLEVDALLLGFVPNDPRVAEAALAQQPLVVRYPESRAAVAIGAIAAQLSQQGVRGPDLPAGRYWADYCRLVGQPDAVASAAQPPAVVPPAVTAEPAQARFASMPTVSASHAAAPGAGAAVLEKKLEVLSRRVAQLAQELEQRHRAASAGTASQSPAGEAEPRLPDLYSQPARKEAAGSEPAPDHQTPVRASTRCSPVDNVQLRRIVGRILIKAVQKHGGEGAVAVQSENVELRAGNEMSLQPGRYSRISIPCDDLDQPDAVIDEIFASCYLVSPRLSLPGSSRHLWTTSARDGAIVVDKDTSEGTCIHVYLAAGGNLWQPEAGETAERLEMTAVGAPGIEALLLRRGAQAQVTAMDDGPLVLYRVPRHRGPALLCAVETGDEAAPRAAVGGY